MPPRRHSISFVTNTCSECLRWRWQSLAGPQVPPSLPVTVVVIRIVTPELLDASVRLIHGILSFDFLGAAIDEATDDVSSLQIPLSWRPVFEDDPNLAKTLVATYKGIKSADAAVVRGVEGLLCAN